MTQGSRCLSKTMVAYLESFLGVSPFYKTQDPRVDANLDVLYKDALSKANEIEDRAFQNYVARKLTAWYTRFPPKKNDKNDKDSDEDDDDAPSGGADMPAGGAGPSKKRGMALSDAEEEEGAGAGASGN